MGAEEAPRSGQRGRGAHAGLRIRPVTGADVAALRDVRLRALASDPDAFGSTLAEARERPDAFWERWAAASAEGTAERTFVAGDFAGLAMVRRDAEAPEIAYIYAMWVAPEARGARLATALCDACADWARERGCAAVRLAVFASNPAAAAAYEAAGFVEYDRESFTTGDGRAVDERRLERRL